MLKEERHRSIVNLLQEKGIIKVKDITNLMNVTEMTVRRDLQELENKGVLQRIHGGAQLSNSLILTELSHYEKQNINIDSKKDIARKIANFINNGDLIFLGIGTTIELVYEFINVDYLKIVTNSLHIFNKFINTSFS